MPSSTLYVDSRHRTRDSTPSTAKFNLIRPISNVHTCRVTSLQFVNTFENLSVDNNELLTSSGVVTLSPDYYSGTNFVLALDAGLVVAFGAGNYVTFNSIYNQLDWTLGANTLDATSASSNMASLLGLDNNSPALTGSFSSTLHIARPSYLAWSCNQLQPASDRSYHASDTESKDNLQPFLTIPVTSSYLSAQTHMPANPATITLDRGGAGVSISRLNFTVSDAASGRVLSELADWAAVVEFD